ncbi:magnesium chelatase [Virgibacillus dakarensis]|nr:magnesium chelatase [Virgibacillus dakarensis]
MTPHGANEDLIQAMVSVCAEQECDQFSLMETGAKWEEAFRFGKLRASDLTVSPRTSALMLTPDAARGEEGGPKQEAFEHYKPIKDYWHASGQWNWQQLFYYVANLWGEVGLPEAEAPASYQDTGIIDPKNGMSFDDIASYSCASFFDKAKPAVVFLYLASQARVQTANVVAELMERLKPFANVIPIGLQSIMKIDVPSLERLLAEVNGGVQLLVNFIGFRLGSGPRGKEATDVAEWLGNLDVPMLHPFFLTRTTLEEWQQARNLAPVEAMVNVVLPELDGAVETYPLAAIQPAGFNDDYQFEKKELALIEERALHFINRVQSWLRLRQTSNHEKRIALIGYNYPPGEGNLFGGSFLDTFSSLSALLFKLAEEGYHVEPMSPEELEHTFRQKQLINESAWGVNEDQDVRLRYSAEKARPYLLAQSGHRQISEQWGAYPGDVMAEESAFFIPGFISGNVFIGLQPSRSAGARDTVSSYHDQSLVPHHQYAAFYAWVEKEFQAHALVHIGTHGTLEYLPGKENGMSAQCYPDQFLGAMPHFYAYYVGNPSEAMLAKRRTHAVLSSYQAPPFRDGGLHGVYAEIERLLHEYREAEQLDPGRLEAVRKEIEEKAESTGFANNRMEDIEAELQRMQYAMIPYGLHVLGSGLGHKDALLHAHYTLMHEHGGLPPLSELVAQAKQSLKTDEEAQQKEALAWIEAYIKDRTTPEAPELLQAKIQKSLEQGARAYHQSRKNEELASLMKALKGEYLPAKLAGDVLRNPDSLPTGSNLYQFDPRAVPSSSAIKRGKEIAEATLILHKESTGQLPNTVACVLWGVETSRTQGETIGQILAYIGARAVKRRHAANTEFELIPLSELGRPRINATISMSGVFRDLFPNVIEMLNELFQKLAEAEEPVEKNFFKAQTKKLYESLIAEGKNPDEAWDLATARIFGPAEGEYGTGVSHFIEEGSWGNESELGDIYKYNTQHVYSKAKRGVSEPDLYDAHMKAADIVSQLRANHEYEVTDLDDYYNFFGGLAKSIETAKGQSAAIYITDTTQKTPRTEGAKTAINRGVRTRLLNPKWIEGLLDHPYHGVQHIAKHTENLLGLAATTNEVDNWVFSAVHEAYVENAERQKGMRAANPHAYHHLVETLIEISERGYWQPSEAELASLKEAYLEAEGEMEA